jgi:hypothetical protein
MHIDYKWEEIPNFMNNQRNAKNVKQRNTIFIYQRPFSALTN